MESFTSTGKSIVAFASFVYLFMQSGCSLKPAPNRRPNPKVSLEMFENYLACLRNGDGAPMALLIAWALSCNCSLSVTDSVDREMIDARAFEQ